MEGSFRYSRESSEALGVEWQGGLLFLLRPLEEMEQENMKTDIKSKLDRPLMNHRVEVEDVCFQLLHTSVFCLTAEIGLVPAELNLARMSLRKGAEKVFQMFIEPGTLHKGYRTDCTENSKATHKIPLDFALFNDNYQQLVEDVLEFLLVLPDCGELSLCCWVVSLG